MTHSCDAWTDAGQRASHQSLRCRRARAAVLGDASRSPRAAMRRATRRSLRLSCRRVTRRTRLAPPARFHVRACRCRESPLRLLGAAPQFLDLLEQLCRLAAPARRGFEQVVEVFPLPPQVGGNCIKRSVHPVRRFLRRSRRRSREYGASDTSAGDAGTARLATRGHF